MANILLSALSARRGGGLTYIRNIVGQFPREPANRLTILSAQPIEGLPDHPNIEWQPAPGWTVRPISRVLLGMIYFRFFWPRRHDFDAVFYAGGSFDLALPKGPKRVVIFQNMLPFDPKERRRYPLGWIRSRLWFLQFIQGNAMRTGDLVVFISDYARGAIDAVISKRRGSSVVIPHGATRTNAPLDPAILALLPERFVLYLSILDVYKAQVEAVEAWAELRKSRPTNEKLVLAGPEFPPYGRRVRDTIKRLGLEGEVILTGPVRHDQVSDLARRASLNLFLSSCENCPSILLELMLVGRPLVVSDIEPMPELGGPGLVYVDPYDPAATARAIAGLLDDPERSAAVGHAAAEGSKLYTWERAGKRTWSAIIQCIGRAPRQHQFSNLSSSQAGHVQG